MLQEWKHRYGYRSAKNDADKNWLIEIPGNKDPYTDYFAERDEAKKERVAKNQLQHLKNVKRGLKEAQRGREQPTYSRRDFGKGANSVPLGVGQDPKERTRQEVSCCG